MDFEAAQRDKEDKATNSPQNLRLRSRKGLQKNKIPEPCRCYEIPSRGKLLLLVELADVLEEHCKYEQLQWVLQQLSGIALQEGCLAVYSDARH